jgi:hypothetical protein
LAGYANHESIVRGPVSLTLNGKKLFVFLVVSLARPLRMPDPDGVREERIARPIATAMYIAWAI